MPVRVLELIDLPMLGGGQQHVLALARMLDRARFEVEVGSAPGGPLVEQLRELGVPHVPCPVVKSVDPSPVMALRSLVRERRYSVVHTHGGVAGLWGRLACAGLSGVGRLHTIHGIHYLNYPKWWKRQGMIWLEMALAPLADRILCVCRSDYDKALAAGVAPAARTRVIRNGIDLAPYQTSGDPALLRREAAVPQGALIVGTVGRLHVQKGQSHLLEAFAALAPRVPELYLALVGGGELRDALERQAGALGIASRVRFLGARRDVAALLPGMDIFALPSLWEGLPLTLMEAMAAGLPCIATAVDGNVELIRHDVDGLLVPPADAAALAGAIGALAADRARRHGLAAAARARALAEFAEGPMVDAIAGQYEEVLRERGMATGR
ncbi:MAG: glycosyltransferase [Candidatus Wallbacteria bacterium]|nr:glycosyltransferase [Candidatus Wallbacteria bacterium]